MDEVSNVEVLERIGQTKGLLQRIRIRIRKGNWIDQVLREHSLLKDMMEETEDGKKEERKKNINTR